MCSPTARAGTNAASAAGNPLPRSPDVRWNCQLQPLVEPQPSQT